MNERVTESVAALDTDADGWSVGRLLDTLARRTGCDRDGLGRAAGAEAEDGRAAVRRLVAGGVIDRIAGRALLLVAAGRLDERDLRSLLAPARLRARLAGLAEPLADAAETPALAVGTALGRYVVKGLLGRGGSSRVYLGLHPALRVPVALKVPLRADAAAADRVRAEAAAVARVSHRNVVRVWDADEADGVPFLVLEYVNGEGLGTHLNRAGRVPVREALAAARDVARGLRAAHRRGVAHRDVKPANLLRTLDGVTKLADFGIARPAPLSSPAPARPALAGSAGECMNVEGTWGYAAPERFDGGGDHRSDVYSLGLTLYHLLGGRPAVHGADFRDCRDRHRRLDLEPLHWAVPGVGPGVDALVRRMTARDPADRFPDYDSLLAALKPVLRRPAG